MIKSITDKFMSSVRTRPAQEAEDIYESGPNGSYSLHTNNRQDYSHLLNKPFFVKTVDWTTSDAFASILTTNVLVPADIVSNALLAVPFLSMAKWKGKMCAIVQVVGTPQHQGTLIAYAYPPYLRSEENSSQPMEALAAPHVLLSANQSTSACLELPFYCASNLAECFVRTTDAVAITQTALNTCLLNFVVLNPLIASSSGTTTLRVSVHIMFKELDFYVPNIVPSYPPTPSFVSQSFVTRMLDNAVPALKDVLSDGIDQARAAIRKITGMDYPTEPLTQHIMRPLPITNLNSTEGVYFADRFTQFPSYVYKNDVDTFSTRADEMDISNIISKPGYVGTFHITTSDLPETLCFTRPMAPFTNPLTTTTSPNPMVDTGPLLQKMSYMAKYWRGSIKFTLHVSASNMHVAKLLVVRRYGLDVHDDPTTPIMESMSGMQTEAIEISAGGQTFDIICPYNSTVNMLPTTPGYRTVPYSHGMLYIYLLQPLVANSTIASFIDVNVFVSAMDDFRFYGPCDFNGIRPISAAGPTFDGETTLLDSMVTTWRAQSMRDQPHSDTVCYAPTDIDTLAPQVPFNVPDPKISVVSNTITREWCEELGLDRMSKPLTSVRDIMRRFTTAYKMNSTSNAVLIPLKVLVALAESPQNVLTHMFYGIKGGLRFRLKWEITGNVASVQEPMVYYIPPRYTLPPGASSFNEQSAFNPLFTGAFPVTFRTIAIGGGYTNPNAATYPVQFKMFQSHEGYSEFEVPIETIFRFNTIGTVSDILASDSAHALGHIVIIQPGAFADATSFMYLEMALADETRLGFQVRNPDVSVVYNTTTLDTQAGFPVDFTPNPNPLDISKFFYTKTV